MKRAFRWLIIILLLGVYIVSLSPEWMAIIFETRNNRYALFPSSRSENGDLYALTYLGKFGRKGWKSSYDTNRCNTEKKIVLFTISDSYLHWRIFENAFCGVSQLQQAHWDYPANYILPDSTKTNIMVIETAERFLRVRAKSPDWMRRYIIGSVPKIQNQLVAKVETKPNLLKWENIKKHVFNPNINQNLEFNLFDYSPFLIFWEARAGVQYNLFKRIGYSVEVSPNGKYLVLKETLDENFGKDGRAANSALPEEELTNIVKNLNDLRDYYLKNGFKEVYISPIPNPIEIVQEGFNYNNLIPKLKARTDLKMPMIDMYPIFKQNSKTVFTTNESHWTNVGMQMWIDEVNKILSNEF